MEKITQEEETSEVGETVIHLDWLKIGFVEFFRALRQPLQYPRRCRFGTCNCSAAHRTIRWCDCNFSTFFIKVRSRAWITAIAYFLIAGVSTYLTWPYLWGLQWGISSGVFKTAVRFSVTRGPVLFMGNIYSESHLPRTIFPHIA